MATDTITGKAITEAIKPGERFNKDLLYTRLTALGYKVKANSCASRINQLQRKGMASRAKEYGHFYLTGTQRNALMKDKQKKRKEKECETKMLDIEKLCLYGRLVN